MEGSNEKSWEGTSWDLGDHLDPYDVREVEIVFDNGDTDTFRPKLREVFYSYELSQMAAYLGTVANAVRTGRTR